MVLVMVARVTDLDMMWIHPLLHKMPRKQEAGRGDRKEGKQRASQQQASKQTDIFPPSLSPLYFSSGSNPRPRRGTTTTAGICSPSKMADVDLKQFCAEELLMYSLGADGYAMRISAVLEFAPTTRASEKLTVESLIKVLEERWSHWPRMQCILSDEGLRTDPDFSWQEKVELIRAEANTEEQRRRINDK